MNVAVTDTNILQMDVSIAFTYKTFPGPLLKQLCVLFDK
jgi:hypothetical protein